MVQRVSHEVTTMADGITSNVLLNVEQAVLDFSNVPVDQQRVVLEKVVTKLCSEELSHVMEIVIFLRKYLKTKQADGVQVLVKGVEELLRYLNQLEQCNSKSGCLLLVYGLLDDTLTDVPEVTNLKLSLEYTVKELAQLIVKPIDDELITVAALFDQGFSYGVLNQLFDETASYVTVRHQLRNVCSFVEHLPCIDQQIKACLVLHRRMLMDSKRFRTGATVLAFRVRKIKRYTDFPRAKYAEELRRLKLKLPEGVYAIVWNYATISTGQFMHPEGRFNQIGILKSKRIAWIGTATKATRHEFITADGGVSFAIRNTDSGLFLTEDDDGFCYVEKTEDTWTVDVVRREDDYFYKITNQRTNNSLMPPQEVRLDLENNEAGYNLVDFTERALVAVQKFELNKASARCVLQ